MPLYRSYCAKLTCSGLCVHCLCFQARDPSFSLFGHKLQIMGDKEYLTGDKLIDRMKKWANSGTVMKKLIITKTTFQTGAG